MYTTLQYLLDRGGIFRYIGRGWSQPDGQQTSIHTIFCTQVLDLEVITAVNVAVFPASLLCSRS